MKMQDSCSGSYGATGRISTWSTRTQTSSSTAFVRSLQVWGGRASALSDGRETRPPMKLDARGEFPAASLLSTMVQGSFDSAGTSLREVSAPLRMTNCLRGQFVGDDNLLAGWPRGGPSSWGFLFQSHEQQDENRPYPNGHRKLHQLSVAQRISSGNQVRKPQHRQSREYPEGQSAPRVHGWISPRFKGRRSGTPGSGILAINIMIMIMLAKP